MNLIIAMIQHHMAQHHKLSRTRSSEITSPEYVYRIEKLIKILHSIISGTRYTWRPRSELNLSSILTTRIKDIPLMKISSPGF
jgi:hypothetical protein